jgi:hypothetical protein
MMTVHLYAPQSDWPGTYCDRGRAWHEPVVSVYPCDLRLVDCQPCLDALLAEQRRHMQIRRRLLARTFGPLTHCA